MKNKVAVKMYEKYIKGTVEKEVVVDKLYLVTILTKAVIKGLNLSEDKVYLNTRVLKHLYDRKPAEEFECIICDLHKIVHYPDFVYKNKSPKRGDFCFTKKIKDTNYFCSIERGEDRMFIVTVFRIRKGKEGYIKNYELLWSWEDDVPPS